MKTAVKSQVSLVFFILSLVSLTSSIDAQSEIVISGCSGLSNEVFTQAEDVGVCACYESSSGIIYFNATPPFNHVYNSTITDCALATNTTPGTEIANGPFCDIFSNVPSSTCSIQVNNSVPTLSQWSLIILGLSMLVFSFVAIRDRVLSV